MLSYCMATRAVSFRVKKRFPDLQHLVDAGLMREDEYKVNSSHQILNLITRYSNPFQQVHMRCCLIQVINKLDQHVTANKWFLPLVWASDICARALAEGNIRPQTVRALIAEICNIREKLTGETH